MGVGSGAREHAIALALGREAVPHELLVAPGNAGIAAVARTVSVDPSDPAAVSALAAAAGAWGVRVHEVPGSRDAVRVAAALTAARLGS